MAGEVKRGRRQKPDEPVEVFDPAYEAHKLKLGGKPFREIYRELGFPTENACRMAVQAYLTRAAAELNKEQKAERLQMQLDRYEEVLATHWALMKAGDDKATAHVLATLRQIDKLYRLDQPDMDNGATKTIVISGNEEQYIAGLRAIVEGHAD